VATAYQQGGSMSGDTFVISGLRERRAAMARQIIDLQQQFRPAA
jgi:hypothetical protein